MEKYLDIRGLEGLRKFYKIRESFIHTPFHNCASTQRENVALGRAHVVQGHVDLCPPPLMLWIFAHTYVNQPRGSWQQLKK